MSFQGKFDRRELRSLKLAGTALNSSAQTGSTEPVYAFIYDSANDIYMAKGAAVPADASSGYSEGCLFTLTGTTAGASCTYVNVGTKTACNFDLVSDA